MPTTPLKKHSLLAGILAIFLVTGILLMVAGAPQSIAGDKKQPDLKAAYKLYQAKCLGCHVSVADPEKAGRTKDGWFVVVNVMHDRGVKLTTEESATIVNLLYKLRKGMEREPG